MLSFLFPRSLRKQSLRFPPTSLPPFFDAANWDSPCSKKHFSWRCSLWNMSSACLGLLACVMLFRTCSVCLSDMYTYCTRSLAFITDQCKCKLWASYPGSPCQFDSSYAAAGPSWTTALWQLSFCSHDTELVKKSTSQTTLTFSMSEYFESYKPIANEVRTLIVLFKILLLQGK